jgi:sulfite exporter TauE/SafE
MLIFHVRVGVRAATAGDHGNRRPPPYHGRPAAQVKQTDAGERGFSWIPARAAAPGKRINAAGNIIRYRRAPLADDRSTSLIDPPTTLSILCGTAALIGWGHTITGPDHYLPFIAMSRIGKWSMRKTMRVTLLCGLGHVLSSIVLGVVGMAAGLTVIRLQNWESDRGALAGWMLLAFGLTYFVWGLWRAIRNRPHTHVHVHEDGLVHSHSHTHTDSHAHFHTQSYAGTNVRTVSPGDSADAGSARMTPWILFTVFVFGPCEPLIPLLMFPAAMLESAWSMVLVVAIFAATTLATMLTTVFLAVRGIQLFELPLMVKRFGHALAGLVVLACGTAVKLGW